MKDLKIRNTYFNCREFDVFLKAMVDEIAELKERIVVLEEDA